MPSVLAIFKFTTRMKWLGRSIGMTPAFDPLKILSAIIAALRGLADHLVVFNQKQAHSLTIEAIAATRP